MKLPSEPCIELATGIGMVPAGHGTLSFANEVRRAVRLTQPTVLAVELPRALQREVLELAAALPEIRLLVYKTPGEPALVIPGDPCDALIEAVRLAREHNIRLELVDTLRGGSEEGYVPLPDGAAVERLGARLFAEEYFRTAPERPITERDRVMAARLRQLAEGGENVLFVGGLGHARALASLLAGLPGALPADLEENTEGLQARLEPAEEQQLDIVLQEIPYAAYLYDTFRAAHGPEDVFPREQAIATVLQRAAEEYHEDYDEEVSLAEWRTLGQFLRSLSAVRGRLRPGIYELLTGAKSCIDGDFGALVYEAASSYPPNAKRRRPRRRKGRMRRAMSLHADFGEGMERLSPAYPGPEKAEFVIEFRRRVPTREEQMLWRESFAQELWTGTGICSWPPEDEFIESFFRRIRQRAEQQLTEEHHAVEEFATGLLDGVDARETARRWHEGKLYVRRERRPPGHVGPVVLLWRDLPLATENVWRSCLYAENNNESDIAVYSQPLGENMAGPGITRSEYHGILSVYPAIGIPDIWTIPPRGPWRTHGQLLLAAAILLTDERYVAYAAAKPPDPYIRDYARAQGRAIVYLPLGSFSKAQLRRARRFHILASKSARNWAGDYIP